MAGGKAVHQLQRFLSLRAHQRGAQRQTALARGLELGGEQGAGVEDADDVAGEGGAAGFGGGVVRIEAGGEVGHVDQQLELAGEAGHRHRDAEAARAVERFGHRSAPCRLETVVEPGKLAEAFIGLDIEEGEVLGARADRRRAAFVVGLEHPVAGQAELLAGRGLEGGELLRRHARGPDDALEVDRVAACGSECGKVGRVHVGAGGEEAFHSAHPLVGGVECVLGVTGDVLGDVGEVGLALGVGHLLDDGGGGGQDRSGGQQRQCDVGAHAAPDRAHAGPGEQQQGGKQHDPQSLAGPQQQPLVERRQWPERGSESGRGEGEQGGGEQAAQRPGQHQEAQRRRRPCQRQGGEKELAGEHGAEHGLQRGRGGGERGRGQLLCRPRAETCGRRHCPQPHPRPAAQAEDKQARQRHPGGRRQRRGKGGRGRDQPSGEGGEGVGDGQGEDQEDGAPATGTGGCGSGVPGGLIEALVHGFFPSCSP